MFFNYSETSMYNIIERTQKIRLCNRVMSEQGFNMYGDVKRPKNLVCFTEVYDIARYGMLY